MKQIKIGGSELEGSQVILGCMRLDERIKRKKKVSKVLQTAFDNGINTFDHADIYGGGKCETYFAQALKETSISRDEILIQSKCGIIPGKAFDFSKEHIIKSVEGSLTRLDTDHLDMLLLHRPDTLMEPVEVAEAFDELKAAGKVRHFGVSNFNPRQIQLLETAVKEPLIANQLQFGIAHAGMISNGLHVNMEDGESVDHDGSILEYSRIKNMTIQAWSPFQYGYFEGIFLDNHKFPELNAQLEKLAKKYGFTKTGIATAWINRHPADIQTVIGSMTRDRIRESTDASDLVLTREEWYSIYMAAGNILP
ncbi:MAG: aldo/keto reductase [Lactobacillales bacterium]|jgi:predicted oxidoreductase|nr:aldo/keto reductase [Lactobacillales bacterium]